jgi:hypothetical protein
MRHDNLILRLAAGSLLLALVFGQGGCTRPPARIKATPVPPYRIEAANHGCVYTLVL